MRRRVAQIPGWARLVNVLENSFAKRKRNKGVEVASGDITVERKAKNLVLGRVQRRRFEQLLNLRTRRLLLCQL